MAFSDASTQVSKNTRPVNSPKHNEVEILHPSSWAPGILRFNLDATIQAIPHLHFLRICTVHLLCTPLFYYECIYATLWRNAY